MYCKLIDAITSPLTLNIAETKEMNGKKIASYKPRRFIPGKKYEVPEGDELFLRSLKDCTQKIKYDPSVEKALIDCGATYEIITCKSCGGRVKKIEYQVAEVIE